MKAVEVSAHVNGDDVAFLQLPGAGDAVDNLLIDGDAGGAGKAAISQEGGLGSVTFDKFAYRGVNLMGGDTGPHHGTGQRPGLGGQPPGPAHQLDFTGRFQ